MSSSPASLSARLAPAAVYELNDRWSQCSGRTAAVVEIPAKQRTPPSRSRCPASASVSVSGSAQPWLQATMAPGLMYLARSSTAASPTSWVTLAVGVPGLELALHQLARLAARQAVDEADGP